MPLNNTLIRNSASSQRGLTLIEILVTLVILAIGLLGLAGLMMDGLRNNQSAYLRTQASLHAYDMADRMRLNREQAISGAYNGYSTTTDVALPSCATDNGGCSAAQQVIADKAEWSAEIKGASGGTALLPGGTGSITRRSGNDFTISISWQETQWDETQNAKAVGAQTFSLNFTL